MPEEDMIVMNQRELRQAHVIQKVLEGLITQTEASEILSLSDRQIRRIVRRVRQEGVSGLVHRSRGRPSNRTTSLRPDLCLGEAPGEA
jgi:transposase